MVQRARRGLRSVRVYSYLRLFGAAMLLLGSLAIRTDPATAVVATGDEVVVQVVNGLTEQALSGVVVVAKRRVGDGFTWAAQQTTDGGGQARFRLEGLSSGAAYAFFAQPYNGGWAQSDDCRAPGSFRFAVGMLPVTLVDGARTPLARATVTVKERGADGSLKWTTYGSTDSNGLITFDLLGLGAGRVYVLEAASPWDGSTKRSNDIRDVGPTTFVVGNAPLNVTLVDALSLAPLLAQRVTAREKLADGSLKWVAQRDTDAGGRVVFDLDGLGSGRTYVLSATVFNGLTSTSADLAAAGDYRFTVGALEVTAVKGGTLEILHGYKITAYERVANTQLKWVAQGLTDTVGVIRLDLPGIDQGRRYALKATSPWDGSTKWSNDLTSNGRVQFVVGNAPLRVTLMNGLTSEVLPGQRVTARERLDGSSPWVAERTTDAAGLVVFDLPGLGEGRKYYLTARPYNGGTAISPDLTAPGDYQFKVGMLEVTVVAGGTSTPRAALPVTAKERLADGTLKSVTSGITDVNGIIRFDLAGLGAGRAYVLEARSPIDGTTKRSDLVTTTGRYTFVVGNAPLSVYLMNALSGDPLPGIKITASERLATGKLQWVSARTTDTTGRTQFDLAGLGNGRVYVLSTVPYNGGTVYSDDLRAPGQYDFKVGSVAVTAVDPVDGTPLPGLRITAKEKAADGTLTWIRQGLTDAAGMVRFDFAGLTTGKTYVLEAASPVDGSAKRSQDITAIGTYLFRVGNAPLTVTVRNALRGTPLPGVTVTARERLADGSTRYVRQITTTNSGQAVFDLDGLGSGRTYVLRCNPYGTGSVDSEPKTNPGSFDFLVGTLEVQVLGGATGAPIPSTEVAAYEIVTSGRKKWMTGGYTDDAGVIRFDLPGLGSGRTYILEAHSPIDGSHKYTQPLTTTGRITFVVGGQALRVTLVNGLTSTPLPATGISAYELLSNGDARWTSWAETDATGVALFDLDGLGSGRTYVLNTDPYDAGGVDSDPISAPGDMLLRVGTVPVTLVDGDTNTPLAGVAITAYEKLSDGELRWAKQATTDAGGVVRFDLEGVSQTTVRAVAPVVAVSRVYVFEASHPYGAEKHYYSPLVDSEGPVEFRITRDGDYPLDVTPPTVHISAPADGTSVDGTGFVVTGTAADDNTLTQVVVTVSDPIRGDSTGTAVYDATREQWTFPVGASMLTVGQTVRVAAQAIDQARNRATEAIAVRVINDMAPPQIVVTSHRNGDSVEKTGFLLSGTATDDVAVTSLTATLDDPVLGRTIDQKAVDVTPGTGAFTLAVLNGQITQGQRVTLSLVATDAQGHRTTTSLLFQVVAVDFEAAHLINRITFGATPALLAEVTRIGPDAFVTQQLNPAGIDDSAFDTMLATQPAPTNTAGLQTRALLHAVHSRRQLREVLTAFWDNHFNTDINKPTAVSYELAENNAFRANALGRFRDLLQVSATSPAMLQYLDNAMSVVGAPNENYARELLELDTLGVNGGYSQRDVEEVARVFTGWTVQNGQFFFNAAQHDMGAKVILGNSFPAGHGIDEGERLLDILASHPSTARFICTKLSRLLVSDTPSPALVDRCATAFLGADGTIATTVETILRSPEFGDAAAFRAKVKTPMEFVVGVARNLSANTNTADLLQPMRDMGMRLFENPVPTGWSETGDDWVNANATLQRSKFVNRVAHATPGGGATAVALRQFFTSNGYTTADGIVGFLFQIVFHHDYTALERDTALNILTNNGTEVFDISTTTAEARLQRLVGTAFSYPGYQFQ